MILTYQTKVSLNSDFVIDLITAEGQNRREVERLSEVINIIPVTFLVQGAFHATKWLKQTADPEHIIPANFNNEEICGQEGFFGFYYDGCRHNTEFCGAYAITILPIDSGDIDMFSYKVELLGLPFEASQLLQVNRSLEKEESNEPEF